MSQLDFKQLLVFLHNENEFSIKVNNDLKGKEEDYINQYLKQVNTRHSIFDDFESFFQVIEDELYEKSEKENFIIDYKLVLNKREENQLFNILDEYLKNRSYFDSLVKKIYKLNKDIIHLYFYKKYKSKSDTNKNIITNLLLEYNASDPLNHKRNALYGIGQKTPTHILKEDFFKYIELKNKKLSLEIAKHILKLSNGNFDYSLSDFYFEHNINSFMLLCRQGMLDNNITYQQKYLTNAFLSKNEEFLKDIVNFYKKNKKINLFEITVHIVNKKNFTSINIGKLKILLLKYNKQQKEDIYSLTTNRNLK